MRDKKPAAPTKLREGQTGLNDRARQRIREEAERRKLSHRNMAGFLGWGFNKVMQKLTGRTPMTLNEYAAMCFAVGLQPTEGVRDRGLEFLAEMTPKELRLLELARALSPTEFDGLLHLLSRTAHVQLEKRRATPPRKTG